MKLNELLGRIGLSNPCPHNPEITSVTDDSRLVQAGSLFVVLQGTKDNGLQYAQQAIAAGAVAVLASADNCLEATEGCWIPCADPRGILGALAHACANDPTREMLVAGVTGTNGKTTTAWLMESIFRAAGHQTGLLGTLFYRIGDEERPALNTTASACVNASLFREMRERGVTAAAMEVSSHAIDQRRIDGIQFNVGVLTNITQDHLDYHKTMENYAAAKWRFFEETIARTPGAAAVFNIDDSYGAQFSARYSARQVRFTQRNAHAEVQLLDVSLGLHGIAMQVAFDGSVVEMKSRLLGRFNVENILAASSAAWAIGIPLQQICEGIARAQGVPGRFERIDAGQDFLVAVDYAHTPDALDRALANAHEMTSGRVIAVFGCGGDRDPGKRPLMGMAVGKAADYAILTTDNPRSEEPAAIARMAEQGLIEAGASGRYEIELDRRAAIQQAIQMAQPSDIVLIAGKGHETYQEIQGVRHHFDDREVAREALQARMGGVTR